MATHELKAGSILMLLDYERGPDFEVEGLRAPLHALLGDSRKNIRRPRFIPDQPYSLDRMLSACPYTFASPFLEILLRLVGPFIKGF